MVNKVSAKIILLCFITAIIIFAVVICVSYFPRRIQHVLSGIELLEISEGEFELLRTLDISIDGRLHYGVFSSQPRFRGLIEVNGYSFTYGNEIEILFDEDFYGGLLYVFAEFSDLGATSFGTIPRVETLGWIKTDRYLSYIIIRVYEWKPHSDGGYISISTGRVILAPANDVETALDLF